MAKESRESYFIGGNQSIGELERRLSFTLARMADRLDIIEGLRPDLSSGFYQLSAVKDISTAGLGGMATQDSDKVNITGGTLAITDANGTVIHSMGV